MGWNEVEWGGVVWGVGWDGMGSGWDGMVHSFINIMVAVFCIVFTSFFPQVDRLVIGGGMVFTFLKARGLSVGSSLVEDDRLDLVSNVLYQKTFKGHPKGVRMVSSRYPRGHPQGTAPTSYPRVFTSRSKSISNVSTWYP